MSTATRSSTTSAPSIPQTFGPPRDRCIPKKDSEQIARSFASGGGVLEAYAVKLEVLVRLRCMRGPILEGFNELPSTDLVCSKGCSRIDSISVAGRGLVLSHPRRNLPPGRQPRRVGFFPTVRLQLRRPAAQAPECQEWDPDAGLCGGRGKPLLPHICGGSWCRATVGATLVITFSICSSVASARGVVTRLRHSAGPSLPATIGVLFARNGRRMMH